jgi:hypothetical protein
VYDRWRFKKLGSCRVTTYDNAGDMAPELSGEWDDKRQAIFAAADADTRYKFLRGFTKEHGPEWEEVR